MRAPLHLTFDDGPDPVWTPRVADLLARHGATATFFVLGWRVQENPAMIADLVSAGHRVELHGDAHLDHELAGADELARDTDGSLLLLRGLGLEPEWWRVPFGRPGPHTRAVAERHGLRLAGWDADTRDWRGDGWAHQPAQVSDAAERGGVVLLHDAIVPGVGRTSASNTLEIVDALLATAERSGTSATVLPPADDTSLRIPSGAPRSPFTRSESTQRSWHRLDRWRRGETHPADAPAGEADGAGTDAGNGPASGQA